MTPAGRTHLDSTEPRSVPEPIRREALNAAMVALQRVLAERDYPLDEIAELELLDVELEARYQALNPEKTH